MRIKKHGSKYSGPLDQKKYEKFKCEKCGCEFSCESDEYYEDLGGADYNYYSGISVSTYTYRTTTKDYLVCSCPECHKIVKKIRERENNLIWSSTSATSNEITNTNTTNGASNAPTEYTFTCKLDNSNLKEVKEALL